MGLQQETPSGPSGGSSDWNGQDHYCNSFQGTISVRAEEHQENQQHLPRAEEVPPHLQETEALKKHPGGIGTDHPSDALRDLVAGEYPPHGVGHTGHGIRRCPRGVTKPHGVERIALSPSYASK